MENNEILDSAEYSGVTDEIRLTSESIGYLKETAKWGKFLAIFAFIIIGIMVIGFLFMGSAMAYLGLSEMESLSAMGALGGAGMTIYVLFIAALYIYPIVKLFQFSKKCKLAIETGSTELMTAALGNLKSLYKFMGILIAIFLGFYALLILIVGIMSLAM